MIYSMVKKTREKQQPGSSKSSIAGPRKLEKRFKIDRLRTPWVPAPAKASSAGTLLSFGTQINTTDNFNIPSSPSPIDQHFTLVSQPRSRKSSKRNMSSSATHNNHTHSSRNTIKVETKLPASKVQISSRNSNSSALTQSQKQRQDPYQRHIQRSSSQEKQVKHSQRRTGTQYTLRSKDSLVDVTACLQEKREEVMKLWEKSILKGDPVFLTNIENANRLALEAAEEVEKLRRKIQDYQMKEDGLSDSDCVLLEQMRVQVLEKVKKFEQADNLLQGDIARQSVSKTSLLSATKTSQQSQTDGAAMNLPLPGKVDSATTFTPHGHLPPPTATQPPLLPANKSYSDHGTPHNVVVLKERPANFSDDSEYENDTYNVNETLNDGTSQINFPKHVEASIFPSLENLSRLKLLYEESITFPPLEQINLGNITTVRAGDMTKTSAVNVEKYPNNVSSNPQSKPHFHTNRVRFTEDGIRGPEADESFSRNASSADDLYRGKISALQRHLMETEHEVEELKSEVERIESDANFRVRILQNSVQDKFETLQIIPDYLQMVDQKLNETVQDKMKLEQALNSQESLIKEIKEQNKALKRETDELREQLRKAENGKDFLSFKNAETEKSNVELRKQVEELTKQVAAMSCHEPRTDYSRKGSSWETEALKIECEELKEQLSQSKKVIQTLRKSKAKLVASLNERIEELMDALQQAQHHKRILGDQIRYLKKSYHELFPPELFKPLPVKKSSYLSGKRNNITTKSSKPVDEPKVQSTVAWQTTGSEYATNATGIKLDDLLKVQI